jgi:hypothetical protein
MILHQLCLYQRLRRIGAKHRRDVTRKGRKFNITEEKAEILSLLSEWRSIEADGNE